MPLRTFTARDGSIWSVWRIEASVSSDLIDMPREWLLFQDEAGAQRRRLVDFPANWESLPDERLELLCKIAVPSRSWVKFSPPGGVAAIEEAPVTDPDT